MVIILVDSGATHNLLNSNLATKMGFYPTKMVNFRCNIMKSKGLCEDLYFSVQKV